MSVAEIKKQLYKAIEEIDDEAFLQAVYTIISSKKQKGVTFELTDDQLQIWEDIREKYLKGKGKSYSWDEVKDRIRKNNGL